MGSAEPGGRRKLPGHQPGTPLCTGGRNAAALGAMQAAWTRFAAAGKVYCLCSRPTLCSGVRACTCLLLQGSTLRWEAQGTGRC